MTRFQTTIALSLLLLAAAAATAQDGPNAGASEIPAKLAPWLAAQEWRRDTAGPVLSLGESGAFDDTHVFAPMVAMLGGRFHLWYCGSSGTAHDVAKVRVPDHRWFRLGLGHSRRGLFGTRFHRLGLVFGRRRFGLLRGTTFAVGPVHAIGAIVVAAGETEFPDAIAVHAELRQRGTRKQLPEIGRRVARMVGLIEPQAETGLAILGIAGE